MLPRHALRLASTAAMRTRQACRTRYACSNNADAAAGRVDDAAPPQQQYNRQTVFSKGGSASRAHRGRIRLTAVKKSRGVDVAIRSVKFRRAFVRLGPAFVKIGQALATRRDVLPPELELIDRCYKMTLTLH